MTHYLLLSDGLAAAYLVDGLHDGGAHFGRERAAHGEAAEGGEDFLLA